VTGSGGFRWESSGLVIVASVSNHEIQTPPCARLPCAQPPPPPSHLASGRCFDRRCKLNPIHRYQELLLSGLDPSLALQRVWEELRKTQFKRSRADSWIEAIHRNGSRTRNYVTPLAFYLGIPGFNYPWGSHCSNYRRTKRSLDQRESNRQAIIAIFNGGSL
jgi:hypothetical protein